MPTNSLHTAPSAAELDELRELARRAGVPIPSNLDYELHRQVLRMRCLYRLRQLKMKQIDERAPTTHTQKPRHRRAQTRR